MNAMRVLNEEGYRAELASNLANGTVALLAKGEYFGQVLVGGGFKAPLLSIMRFVRFVRHLHKPVINLSPSWGKDELREIGFNGSCPVSSLHWLLKR